MKLFIPLIAVVGSLSGPASAAESCATRCERIQREATEAQERCNTQRSQEVTRQQQIGALDPQAAAATATEACIAQVRAQNDHIAAYCDAKGVADTSKKRNTIGASVFTAGAVVCALECFPFGPKGVCTPASMAAMGYDTISSLILKEEGAGTYTQLSASIMGIAAMRNSSQTATAGAQASGGMSKTTVACVQMGVMALVATLKWKNMGKAAETAASACAGLQSLASTGNGSQTNAAAPFQDAATSGRGTTSGGRTGGGGGSGDTVAAEVERDLSQFPDGGVFQAATAGTGKEFLDNIQERSKFPEVVKANTGMSIGDIAKKLESGQGPGSILAGLSGMPADLAANFKQLDADAMSGKLAFKDDAGGSSSYAATSGKGGAAKNTGTKKIAFGGFGFGAKSVAGSAPKELNFGQAARRPASLTGDDIWHSSFDGTIFEIVSRRLDTTRDRIHQLEWDHPLNRALTGLPKK